MMASTPLVADSALPDGQLDGYGVAGTLIVSLQYMPVFKRLVGTEDDEREVSQWHISPGGARRMAAISAWRTTAPHWPTMGSA